MRMLSGRADRRRLESCWNAFCVQICPLCGYFCTDMSQSGPARHGRLFASALSRRFWVVLLVCRAGLAARLGAVGGVGNWCGGRIAGFWVCGRVGAARVVRVVVFGWERRGARVGCCTPHRRRRAPAADAPTACLGRGPGHARRAAAPPPTAPLSARPGPRNRPRRTVPHPTPHDPRRLPDARL